MHARVTARCRTAVAAGILTLLSAGCGTGNDATVETPVSVDWLLAPGEAGLPIRAAQSHRAAACSADGADSTWHRQLAT